MIDENLNLTENYIKIWRGGKLFYFCDEEKWNINYFADDDILDLSDVLNDLANGKEIDDYFEVERTFVFNDPEVLKCCLKDAIAWYKGLAANKR